jgi:hypothetical protein
MLHPPALPVRTNYRLASSVDSSELSFRTKLPLSSDIASAGPAFQPVSDRRRRPIFLPGFQTRLQLASDSAFFRLAFPATLRPSSAIDLPAQPSNQLPTSSSVAFSGSAILSFANRHRRTTFRLSFRTSARFASNGTLFRPAFRPLADRHRQLTCRLDP